MEKQQSRKPTAVNQTSSPHVRNPKWKRKAKRGFQSATVAPWVERIASLEPDGEAMWVGERLNALRCLAAANAVGENVACFRGTDGSYRVWRFGKCRKPVKEVALKDSDAAVLSLKPDGVPIVFAKEREARRLQWTGRRRGVKTYVRGGRDGCFRLLRVGP